MTRPTRPARAAAVVVALLFGISAVACSAKSTVDTAASTTVASGSIVFPRPPDQAAAIKAANMPAMSQEAFVVHHHGHIAVNINGQNVVVPAYLGITDTSIAPLHTHDDSGVMHIESANTDTITMGQFFTLWGVKLTTTCVNTYCSDDKNQLLFFVDGKQVPDLSTVAIAEHMQVYVWYGPKGTTPTVPTFDFAKAGV